MVDILYVQVNVIGMLILGVILMNQQNIDNGTGRDRAFIYLNYSVFIVLILDSAMWLLNGKLFPFAIEINWVISSIYYLFHGFTVFIWFIYISLFFKSNKIKNKKYLLIMCIPVILNSLFVLFNLRYNIYFSIDRTNIYTRSPLFICSLLAVIPYIFVPFFDCLMLYRTTENIIEKKDCILILKIHFLPVIGIILQVLFYGISLIWICAVLSLLFIFINFQNKRIFTDPLTQLNNRYQFDVCLQSIYRDIVRHETFSILFIDVDKFKEINDRYGHVFGDRVLISVAAILRGACEREQTIIGRYGGDEFYVFCKSSEKDGIIERITRNVELYNESEKMDITLSLSIGTSDFNSDGPREGDEVVERADKAMYKNKIK